MRRGWFLFVILLSVFLIGRVNAVGYLCSNSQEILTISDGGASNSNSHGEIAIADSFGLNFRGICYNDFFPNWRGLNPNDCGASDEHLVLKLSGIKNAHAEGPLGVNYNTKVCHEGLISCYLDVSGVCSGGGTEIVKLSDVSNAHLGTVSGSGYTNIICCEASGSPPTTGVYWADMQGVNINLEKTYIGNTVKLVATGAPQNTEITFEIFERDAGINDKIRTDAEAKKAYSDSSGRAEVNWTITQEDYDKGWESDLTNENEGDSLQIYFTASDGGTYDKTSADILLQPFVGNSPPVANILSPLNGEIYFVGNDVSFSQDSYDSDGWIKTFEWKIGDEPSFIGDGSDFIRRLSKGLKVINLKVTDNVGDVGEAEVAILVLGGSGMFAFIDKPSHLELVRGSIDLDYSGGSSYVVSYDDVACTIDCVAGNCPTSVTGVDPGCSTFNFIGTSGDFSSLYFNWTFYSNFGNSFGFNTDNFGEIGVQKYDRFSKLMNDKLIVLNLSHEPSVLSEIFKRRFTLVQSPSGGICIGSEFWKFDGTTIIKKSVDTDAGTPPACAGPDGVASTTQDNCACSTPGFYCDQTNGCQEQSQIKKCGDYTPLGEVKCNEDIYDVAKAGVEPLWDAKKCDYSGPDGHRECSCSWDLNINECKLKAEFIPHVGGSTPSNCAYSCSYTSSELDECSEGWITLNVGASFQGDTVICPELIDEESACNAENRLEKLPCGRPEIALPFFGGVQFLITFVFVAMIYFLMSI